MNVVIGEQSQCCDLGERMSHLIGMCRAVTGERSLFTVSFMRRVHYVSTVEFHCERIVHQIDHNGYFKECDGNVTPCR